MNSRVHPEAEARFNAMADEVLAAIEEVPAKASKSTPSSFKPDTFPAAHFTEKDIISITNLGSVDRYSLEAVELMFHPEPGDRAFRLSGDGCRHFEQLVRRISILDWFRLRSTHDRIRTLTIQWLSDRIGNAAGDPLVSRLIAVIEPTVRKRVAVVPVAFLHVESEVPFGKVVLRPMDSAFFESISKQNDSITDETRRKYSQSRLVEYRKKRQGYAGVFVELEGDPEFAAEQGVREAAHAIAMLRFFAPEGQYPEACSYLAPADLLPPPSHDVWLFDQGETEPTVHVRGGPPPPPLPLTLDKRTIAGLRTFAFDELSHLARGQGLTEFEKSLEVSVLLFSKAVATASPAEKLVFVLVALESLLLRSPSEPIQQSVGDRFGFLLSKVPAERQHFSKLFKSSYDLRSSFVHHGRNPADLELLREFLRMAWVLLMRLLRSHRAFASKAELLDHLDSLKYS